MTPAPVVELLKKQNDNRFLGYLSYLGGYTSENCDVGGTYYQHGGYAGCCTTTGAACNFPIGCVSGSLVYTYTTGTVTGGTYACSALYTEPSEVSQTVCATAFIFENADDSNPYTDVFCGESAVNWSYYRVKPTQTASSISSAAATTTFTPSTAALTSSPTSTSTPTHTSAPAPSKSKAWIAGVVVGPIALIAIAGLVTYIFFLKKKQRNAPQNPPAQLPPQQYPQYGPGPQGGAAIGQPPMAQAAYSPSMSPAPQYIPNSPAGVQQQWQGQGQQQGWVGAEPKQNAQVGAAQVPSPGPFPAELDGRHM